MSAPSNESGPRAATVSYLSSEQHDGDSPLVPAGRYELSFKYSLLIKRFDRGVLELWFTINDFGPHFGLQLPRYYNVTITSGKRSFRARPQCAFAREYCALFGQRPKYSCAPLKAFENVIVEGVIEEVSKDYRQKTISKAARYSTIRELRRVL